MLLGAVGAYEWNGTVVMYTPGGDVVPGKDAFYDPLKEARNERLAAYLGEWKLNKIYSSFKCH